MSLIDLPVAARRPTAVVLDPQARATVMWIATLWALMLLLQRLVVPGLPVALLLPVCFAWAAWGFARGLAELDRTRLTLWLISFGSAAALTVAQSALLPAPLISVTSVLLFAAVWAPFTMRLKDRRLDTYLATLQAVFAITLVLAVAAIVMMVSQLLGVPYHDWFADLVPAWLRFDPGDFVITYPVEYGSPIYRANGWIGLEPSFVSAQMGVAIVAGFIARVRTWLMVVMFAGMLCSTAGSGFLIVAVALVFMVFTAQRRVLLHYWPLAVGALLAVVLTPIGQNLLGRIFEGSSSRSSTSLRTILPYTRYWPDWTSDLGTVLFGRGPGSTMDLLVGFGVSGLLVPTPIKIFFEYGVVVGLLIAGFLLLCMFRGPSGALAFTMWFSLWTLQPGTTTLLIVVPALMLVTLWSPREGLATDRISHLDTYPDSWFGRLLTWR